MILKRSDILTRVASRMSLHGIADIELVISVVLNAIKERLTVGERVELRGFGSFYTSYREPRLGRNPRTGLRLAVSGKWVPHFKAGKEMRNGVMSRIGLKVLSTSGYLSPSIKNSGSATTKYPVEQGECYCSPSASQGQEKFAPTVAGVQTFPRA